MTSDGLLQRWPWAKLDDVLEPLESGGKLQMGWSPQCEKEPALGDETWAVLKTTAIQPGEFVPDHNKRLPQDMSPRPAIEVRSGDLLLTNAGPRARCGIPCLVRSTRPRLMLSGKMYRFRPNPDLYEARLLEYFLLSPGAQARIDSMKTGISDSGLNLTQGRFLGLPIPVPPIEEQRRIVDILEDHLSRLDAGSRLLQSTHTKMTAWRRAIIDEAIWTKDFPTQSIAGLLREPMRNGHSARASASGSGVRTLTLTAVTQGEFSNRFTKITSAEPSRVSDLWLRSGDILVQRANTTELVGTTALFAGPDDWAIFPDLLIRLRVDESLASPAYVASAIRSERAHRWLRGRAKGLAGSMPKIDQGTIGALQIPVPSRDIQGRLVAALDDIDAAAVRMRRSTEHAVRAGAGLRRSLLAAAFSGRLTADRSRDEQIEELANV